MSIYPSGIVEFREKVNLPGIEYDPDDKRTLFVEDMQKVEGEIVAIEETLGEEVQGDYPTLADRLTASDDAIAAILPLVYPVGSVYYNASDNSNPADLFGFGTWAVFAAGRAIFGVDTGDTDFNTGGKTGGHKTIDLSHTHGSSSLVAQVFFTSTSGNGLQNYRSSPSTWVAGSRGFDANPLTDNSNQTGGTAVVGNTDSGGSASTNILNPYQTVYAWKRTA